MGRAASRAIVAVGWVLAASLGLAQGRSAASGPEDGSNWARGNTVLFGVTQPAVGLSAQWRFQRSAAGDILLELTESRAGQNRTGSLLLLAEGALATRNLVLDRGRELDALHGPLLMLQLVLQLLERAAPGGARSLERERVVSLAEPDRTIKVSAIGADGEFLAPWTLKGTVAPAAGGQVRFELEFVSASRARSTPWYETTIAGIWQSAAPPPSFPDTMPLRGWRVYQIKPVVESHGTVNLGGIGTSAPMAFSHLGEVRRRAHEWAAMNDRRARWQCR